MYPCSSFSSQGYCAYTVLLGFVFHANIFTLMFWIFFRETSGIQLLVMVVGQLEWTSWDNYFREQSSWVSFLSEKLGVQMTPGSSSQSEAKVSYLSMVGNSACFLSVSFPSQNFPEVKAWSMLRLQSSSMYRAPYGYLCSTYLSFCWTVQSHEMEMY